MIPIKHDGEPTWWVRELCCFCWKPTNYWNIKRDVACCPDCAKKHKVSELPTKKQWCDDPRNKIKETGR